MQAQTKRRPTNHEIPQMKSPLKSINDVMISIEERGEFEWKIALISSSAKPSPVIYSNLFANFHLDIYGNC